MPACLPALRLPVWQPEQQAPAEPLQKTNWTKELPKYLPWLKRTSPYYNLISDESQIWQGEPAPRSSWHGKSE